MRFISILLTLFLLAGLISGCGASEPADIAVTILPVFQFTQRLCEGTDLTVTRLVTESVSCLHDYSLTVSQVKAAESAETVILSGAGLESFMHDLLESANATIDSSEGLELLTCEHTHEHEGHSHEHETDAHIWLSPANAKVMVTNIFNGLSAQYPQHRTVFEKNLTSLLADLDALQTYGESQLSSLSCRELVTFHDGFAYFAEAFDLTILEAVEEESGSEASAQELIHLIELVRERGLPAIFTEVNGSDSAARIISAETGAPIFALDMAIGGDDYFQAMYHNIDTIQEALG